MQQLITVLVFMVVFAILAFGMKWICDSFFPGFQPAYWICGIILLIVLLVAVNAAFGGAGTFVLPWHRTLSDDGINERIKALEPSCELVCLIC